MTITHLHVNNFKRVRAVRVDPGGPIVTVGGRNGAGKSSVLDAIMAALGGTGNCPQKPVREGAERGEVRIKLANGYEVVRAFAPSGHTELQVLTPAGDKAAGPQNLLNSWLGELAFDPLEFERMKPRQQAEALKGLLGLDTAQIDQHRAEAYAERTDVHRRQKEIEARSTDFVGLDDVPDQEVSAAELAGELAAVAEHNAKVREHGTQLERSRDAAASAGAMVERAQADIADLEARLATAKERLGQAEALRADADAESARLVEAMPIPRDPREIQERLDQAEATNQKVRRKRLRDELRAEWATLETRRAQLESAIETCDHERQRLLKEAPYPYPGLEYAEEGVTLNGLPFEQASQAERLRASVAIALAQNPQLAVMLVRDGSLLDSESMADLAAIAAERGAQVWVEVVAERSEDGDYPAGLALVIEDGEQVLAAGAAQ